MTKPQFKTLSQIQIQTTSDHKELHFQLETLLLREVKTSALPPTTFTTKPTKRQLHKASYDVHTKVHKATITQGHLQQRAHRGPQGYNCTRPPTTCTTKSTRLQLHKATYNVHTEVHKATIAQGHLQRAERGPQGYNCTRPPTTCTKKRRHLQGPQGYNCTRPPTTCTTRSTRLQLHMATNNVHNEVHKATIAQGHLQRAQRGPQSYNCTRPPTTCTKKRRNLQSPQGYNCTTPPTTTCTTRSTRLQLHKATYNVHNVSR